MEKLLLPACPGLLSARTPFHHEVYPELIFEETVSLQITLSALIAAGPKFPGVKDTQASQAIGTYPILSPAAGPVAHQPQCVQC